jgi:hypothetical protein
MQHESTQTMTRNPFGTMDVPEPNDREAMDYAASAILSGCANDANATRWVASASFDPLDGGWASRWNGGADPTIPGDTADKWKEGRAEVRVVGNRVYLRFDWDGGCRHGMIDAQRQGVNRLVGKYINLTDPKIMRPWAGLIVNSTRIDGRFPNGRLDFRR